MKSCRKACSTPADCTKSNIPIYGADNYDCVAGACEYKGCNSSQECTDQFKTTSVCGPSPAPYTSNQCYFPCTTVNDCFHPGAPATKDADNFACVDGLCRDVGCGSTQECIDALKDPALVCAQFPDLPLKTCVRTCGVVADCAPPGSPPTLDEDNFVCVNGLCKSTGCNSDEECNAAGAAIPYVCR
ncbi:hypothetical protein [Polyangium spumosum]|uniref:DUF7478 domain-containing protein n=1 Tax=Polyangium spumosum TaxID=889282 RepID=A0A6N7PYC9_9BACT|nr:hypothetical protein [Polyangium spumosum]MRG97023.1 hypothetical protein [Polyangium spumosum]